MKKNCKWLYLLLAGVFLFSTAYSQTCDLTTTFCTQDLRDTIPGIKIDSVYGVNAIRYGLSPSPAGYKDVRYSLNDCNSNNNDATICETSSDTLRYFVYYPTKINLSPINYNTCPLPAVILFHGGSYDECSGLDNKGILIVAADFAKRGFVVFDVEYRKGVLVDRRQPVPLQDTNITYTSAQQILAIYRAGQDARGAIWSIIKRQRLHASNFPEDPYQIDTTKIFVGGISAGSLVAMNAAYYQSQDMINAVFPNTKTALGPIEQNYYFGDTTIEFVPLVKGVVNMWGGMFLPVNKINNPGSFFTSNSVNPPMVSFQGDSDQVFNIDSASIYFSPPTLDRGVNFNSETHCLLDGISSYTLPGDSATRDGYVIGAESIYTLLKKAHVPTELYVDCTMRHGLDDDGPGFNSDFGTGLSNSKDVYNYMVSRAATFFQAIIGNVAGSLGRSRFVECVNNRKKCSTADAASCVYTFANEATYSCTDFLPGFAKSQSESLQKITDNDAVHVYPNPGNSTVTVERNVMRLSKVRLVITDVTGNLKIQREIVALKGQMKIPVDISSWANGVYFVTIFDDQANSRCSLIKE